MGEQVLIEASELADLRKKAGWWDDLDAIRRKPPIPADDTWQALARMGKTVEAIKSCRALHGYGLREARDVVEGHLRDRK